VASEPDQRLVEPIGEQRPVGQTGEVVVEGLVAQPRHGHGPLEDVAQLAGHVGHQRAELVV
jgi:hypothetical protein